MRWLDILFVSLLVHLGACGILAAPAGADTVRRVLVIGNDLGGNVLKRELALAAMRVQTDEVQVKGVCVSACTLLLAVKYNFRVCVGPAARFGFHKPFLVDQNGTPGKGHDFTSKADRSWRHMFLEQFRPDLREYLQTKHIPSVAHGDNITSVYWLEGAELHAFVPLCTHLIGSN